MKTVDNFFSSAQIHPSSDRESKIEELKKPVYSKKLKQKRHRRIYGSTQFIAFSDLKSTLKALQKNTRKNQQKVKRSKSDLFLTRKKENFQNEEAKTINLGNNLIIEKLQYDKETGKLQINKNNFIKTLTQITLSGNNTPIKQKTDKNKSQKYLANTHTNFFKPLSNEEELINKQKSINEFQNKPKDWKQNIRIVKLVKKSQAQQDVINELNFLRKKRQSLALDNKTSQPNKKESLIRKNSLFLMNYLKQKEKQSETDKSPHINFMRNTAQNIKIQQNIDLRKNLINKINQKSIFRNKIEQQKVEKMNKIFNTIEIDPW